MSKIDDGGPAFPLTKIIDEEERFYHGLSMRDWFAGMALQGLTSRAEFSSMSALVDVTYNYADAMLARRKEKTDE